MGKSVYRWFDDNADVVDDDDDDVHLEVNPDLGWPFLLFSSSEP